MNIKPCCGCPDGKEYIHCGCDCHNEEVKNNYYGMSYEQMICDLKDFIVSKGLEEKFIDFVAKADKDGYKDYLDIE